MRINYIYSRLEVPEEFFSLARLNSFDVLDEVINLIHKIVLLYKINFYISK